MPFRRRAKSAGGSFVRRAVSMPFVPPGTRCRSEELCELIRRQKGTSRRKGRIVTEALKGCWPMILGVGTDLIDIRRIESTIARFGDRFLDRVFTETRTRRRSPRRASPAAAFCAALCRQGSLRQSARHRLSRGGVLAGYRRRQLAERPALSSSGGRGRERRLDDPACRKGVWRASISA